MDIIKTIEELSAIPGVSGNEDQVRDYIMNALPQAAECSTDSLGNLLVFVKGKQRPKSKIMFSAHMDEVGFIITGVEESGLLRFSTVGGIDPRVVIGKSVLIGDRQIFGVIGSKAVHHQSESERETPVAIEKLFIDIGAGSAIQAQEHVQQGDRAVFFAEFTRLGAHKIMGRAFDDRAGCALMLALINEGLAYDCHFAFTVQEESGCTGAKTAGYTINPDIAVALETTTACDIPGTAAEKTVCVQNKGAAISIMDRGAIYDAPLVELALKTAEQHGIPVQTKSGIFGGNEARSLQVARAGARIMAVNLPCRYLHTPSCVLDVRDIDSTFALLKKLLPALAEL